MDDWLQEMESGGVSGACSARLAARKILEESLRQSGLSGTELSLKLTEIFDQVEKDLNHYIERKQSTRKSGAKKDLDCEKFEETNVAEPVSKEKELCVDYAPVVLDLLLQQHMKHGP